MTLREKRCAFTELLCELIVWCVTVRGWKVALDEGTVKSPRLVRIGDTVQTARDAMHGKRGTKHSFHNDGLAVDLLLYDDLDGDGEDDDYVADGDDPRWREIAVKWESLHPLATSGRRWNDSNHVSFGESAKVDPLPL